MTSVPSIDPRTGEVVEIVTEETSAAEVGILAQGALAALPDLDALGRSGRAVLLRASADALETRRAEILALADRETALGAPRLGGELTRTCFQLRLFAEVLEEGGYLEAAIDHAGESAMGARPDLRRMLVPLGPVAVFGASNFPLAFSVPGGDTASALAAGCPVVVKAHESHPATSQLCFQLLSDALIGAGAPPATLALVHGREAGAALVVHPAIRAVGFTGSLLGGRALVALIESRPDPIPFYGELSSLNPLVVTPAAAAERAEEIGTGFASSFTLGAGQFCTKPGLAFIPSGVDGDRLVAAMATAVTRTEPQTLLNERIVTSFKEATARMSARQGVTVAATGRGDTTSGFIAVPVLLTTTAQGMAPEMREECFGPVSVVARYDSEADLFDALDLLPASLTTTVHTGHEESELPSAVSAALKDRSGRLVYNGYPTGVAVSWAQHHGGPWPSTNSSHTSVGTSAIRRFLRPMAWQSATDALLPPELRDGDAGVPRRVDGELVLPLVGQA